MHSGNTSGRTSTGWSGEIEQPTTSPHGRGRSPDSGPLVLRPTAPDAPGDEPLTDTSPTGGLHKFDLGTVPASVTPPRSWRRAAWFAVISSAATLSGLMFATAALVDDSSSFQVMDLPNMPRGGEYPPLPNEPYVPGPTGSRDTSRPPSSEPAGRQSSSRGPQGVVGSVIGPGPTRRPAPIEPPPAVSTEGTGSEPPGNGSDGPNGSDGSDAPEGPGDSTGSGAPPESDAPPGETEDPTTPELPPAMAGLTVLSDRDAMRQLTDRYFTSVTDGDLRAAYAMTAGELRAEGFAAFAARYSGAASIEVTGSSVRLGSTVTTLRITRDDGTVLTQRRRLEFTSGEDPRIVSDELVR